MPVARPTEDLEAEQSAMVRKYPIWPLTGIPAKWIDRKRPDYEESIFQAPLGSVDVTAVGEIKGRPATVARSIRKLMQKEAKASSKSSGALESLGVSPEGEETFRKLLRGTWWHGRNTPPDPNKLTTFSEVRRKGTLFGEPVGTSVSKNPMAADMFGKLLRVKPVFKGDPLKEVLFHQYEPHAKVINKAYEETVKSFAGEYPALRTMRDVSDLRNIVAKPDFNARLTQTLENKGYKGILYSPVERYGEWELKMFPGKWDTGKTGSENLLYVDQGYRVGDKTLKRYDDMFGVKMRKEWLNAVRNAKYHHLKEHYNKIDLASLGEEINKSLPTTIAKPNVSKVPAPPETINASTPVEAFDLYNKGLIKQDEYKNMVTSFKKQGYKYPDFTKGESPINQLEKIKKDKTHIVFSDLPPHLQNLTKDMMNYANHAIMKTGKVLPQDADTALKNIIKHTGMPEEVIKATMQEAGGMTNLIEYVQKKEKIKKSINKHQMMDAIVVYTQHKTKKGVYTENEILSSLQTIKNATGLTLKEINHLAKLDAKETLFSSAFGHGAKEKSWDETLVKEWNKPASIEFK